jgi:hypothetical protein
VGPASELERWVPSPAGPEKHLDGTVRNESITPVEKLPALR